MLRDDTAWSCAPLTRLLWPTARSPISNGLQWTWRDCAQYEVSVMGRGQLMMFVDFHHELLIAAGS